MKKLKINLTDLEFALENDDYDVSNYLDLETGNIISIDSEIKGYVEELLADEHTLETALAAIEKMDVADWQRPLASDAVKVEFGDVERYLETPRQNSNESWRDMEAFIDTVSDERLQEKLLDVIHRAKPFRHFKDTLERHPKMLNQWYEFEKGCQHQRIVEWLASEDIDATFE